MRSTDPEQLIRLEVELYRALEDAVTGTNGDAARTPAANSPGSSRKQQTQKLNGRETELRLSIQKIGERPAGRLPASSSILRNLRAVDRHLGIHTEERIASTDANIPLSLGVEALSIGAGGAGGGVHTTREWYDARDRELGLRRILLLLLAMANDDTAEARSE
jgi:di/tripeptidase